MVIRIFLKTLEILPSRIRIAVIRIQMTLKQPVLRAARTRAPFNQKKQQKTDIRYPQHAVCSNQGAFTSSRILL